MKLENSECRGKMSFLRLGVHADGVVELEDVGVGGVLRRVGELGRARPNAAPPRRKAGRLG